jgi:hypothetical protein
MYMYLTLRALRVQGNFVWRLDQLQVDICLAVHMGLHSMSLAPSVPPQYHGNHHSHASWTGIGLCEVCCGRCLLDLIGGIVRLKHS